MVGRAPWAATAPRGGPFDWRMHDRTHLELPVLAPRAEGNKDARFVWEAYFFAPESFRLDLISYGKEALDADFKSYVRFALPELCVGDLGDAQDRLERALGDDEAAAVRATRLFGCRVHRALDVELDRLGRQAPIEREVARDVAFGMQEVLGRFRRLVSRCDDGGEGELAVAMRWVDEDLSLKLEATLVRLGQLTADPGVGALVPLAVEEARYRQDAGYPTVVDGSDTPRDSREMERLEFRRHTLKRFIASVLWLSSEAEDPAKWAKHVLYGLAASFAMTFAVAATLLNGPVANPGELGVWLLVAVAAYAVKDRMKASLQDVFQGMLSKRFPDRRWRIRRRDGQIVGLVDERSGFARFDRLPEDVLAARRITRQHPIEEEARPETVLWHQKTISVEAGAVPDGFAGLLEIFRVDLRRWLVHADDAKNRMLVADPNRGVIDAVVAPRVYNIAIVYRIQNGGSVDEGWRRARVVVTRKGIRRIEHIR